MPTIINDRQLVGGDFSVYVSTQTTKGAIDANPVFEPVRRVSGRAKKAITYTESAEVSLDYNGVTQIQDGKELTAEIETEATEQTVKFLISALHGTEQVVSVAGITIASTVSGFTDSANGFTNIAAGDFVFVGGFANTAINRHYLVTAKANNGAITTYPAPAAAVAAGASVTVKTNKTYNANTPTYYTVQNRVTDLSAVGDVSYETQYDHIINQITFAVGETGVITSTVSMLGEKEVEGDLLISGQTTSGISTDAPLSSLQSIADWFFNGESALCILKSATFTVNNNYQSDDAAGCTKRYGRGQPQFTFEGSSRSNVSDSKKVERLYKNGTRISFGVTADHGSGKKTVIMLHKAILTEHSQPDENNAISADTFSGSAEKSTYGYTMAVFRNWV